MNLKQQRLAVIVLTATIIGCSSQHHTAASPENRLEPTNLQQILSTHEPGVLIGRTYWHCEASGALLEAIAAKSSWWWVVEPEGASSCTLKQIPKARFDELDPRATKTKLQLTHQQ